MDKIDTIAVAVAAAAAAADISTISEFSIF